VSEIDASLFLLLLMMMRRQILKFPSMPFGLPAAAPLSEN
jgi:hypothetical protein